MLVSGRVFFKKTHVLVCGKQKTQNFSCHFSTRLQLSGMPWSSVNDSSALWEGPWFVPAIFFRLNLKQTSNKKMKNHWHSYQFNLISITISFQYHFTSIIDVISQYPIIMLIFYKKVRKKNAPASQARQDPLGPHETSIACGRSNAGANLQKGGIWLDVIGSTLQGPHIKGVSLDHSYWNWM